jgi:hypothetical protein
MGFKQDLLEGRLQLPLQGHWEDNFPEDIHNIQRMWNALWYNYLRKPESTTSVPYWFDQFEDYNVFRSFIEAMAKANWIITSINDRGHWGDMRLNQDKLLEVVTEDELTQIRVKFKCSKYVMQFKQATKVSATRQNGVVRDTGLIREGFALAGNTQFGLDTVALEQHLYPIQRNLTKSMEKVKDIYPELKADKALYDEVALEIADYYKSNSQELYTLGDNYNDSRGRAISSGLSKIGNPISSKDFRALLVVTYD